MTSVSRRRATYHSTLFTFVVANGLIVAASMLAGCGSENIRVHMRAPDPSPSTLASGPPMQVSAMSAATSLSSLSQASTKLAAPSTVATGLAFQRVPERRLNEPWSVRFGPGCFDPDSEQHDLPRALVEGDFAAAGYVLRLKLDSTSSREFVTRQAARRSVAMTTLMDPWTPLQPGRHRLVAYAAHEKDGQVPLDNASLPAVSVCDFDVAADGQWHPVQATPDVVVLGVEGTLHGAATSHVSADVFVVPSHALGTATRVQLFIQRPDGGREVHDVAPGAHRLFNIDEERLPSGDYVWVARIADARAVAAVTPSKTAAATTNERALAHTVTVNSE